MQYAICDTADYPSLEPAVPMGRHHDYTIICMTIATIAVTAPNSAASMKYLALPICCLQ